MSKLKNMDITIENNTIVNEKFGNHLDGFENISDLIFILILKYIIN